MGNSFKNSLIVAFTTFSAVSLFGCGDEPEPNQTPPAPAPVAQAAPAPAAVPAPAEQAAGAPAVAAPAVAPVPAVVSYKATLAEGVDFKKPGYPDFISEVTGVSGLEPWGRWTDGKTATFKFKDPLPKKFTLLVEAGAYVDSQNKPVKFLVGGVEKECIFKSDPFGGPRVATLHFNSSEPGNTLIITIPSPKAPAPGTDARALGIGLITMKVDTSGKY